MRYRTLGSSDLEVSEIALGSWLTYSGGVAAGRTRACTEVDANAKASGIELGADTLAAIDEALGDVPVTGQTLAPLAEPGIKRR